MDQRFDLQVGDDRRLLRGRVVRPQHGEGPFPVVLCAHGYTGFMDWGFWPPWSRHLSEHGIASVRFNFPGTGIGADLETLSDEEAFQRNDYLRELEELAAVRQWIDAHAAEHHVDPDRIALLGHSRGGGMAVVHAAEHPGAYRAVVTWNAIASILRFPAERLMRWRHQGWIDVYHHTARKRIPLPLRVLETSEQNRERLNPTAAAARLEAPLLVVQGETDTSVTMEDARALFGAARRGELAVIRNGDHVFGARHRDARGIPLERAFAASAEFLKRVLS